MKNRKSWKDLWVEFAVPGLIGMALGLTIGQAFPFPKERQMLCEKALLMDAFKRSNQIDQRAEKADWWFGSGAELIEEYRVTCTRHTPLP